MTNPTPVLISAVALCAALGAQAQEPVLKGSQATESALIDALTIEGPAAAPGATRGFRPAPESSTGTATKKPATGPGKASLLITFGTDSSVISTDAQSTLDALAKALQSDKLAGFTFRVEGHADARGDASHNMELSQQRAEAVANYLVEKYGILRERLIPVGKGDTEPMNKERIDAPENRRVTIVTVRN